ncbi:MAG: hypothetical protein KKB77_07090, partial [Bacteroidetes bacterium]|nr:hypothetical protein [Bacteroidota bacterium]
APGDTQEVVVAILIAIGTSNINSIAILKGTDAAAQKAYDLDFVLADAPPPPKVTTVGLENKVVFYWEKNAESYDVLDPLITGRQLADTTYSFEGYEIYQYRDMAGTDPVLLVTYDLVNDVTKILDYQTVHGENVLLPVAVGSNSGLYRYFELKTDSYSQKALKNGSPYYVGVVAYGYCPNSSPKVMKSTHRPIEVFAQRPAISTEFTYQSGSFIDVNRVTGTSDGFVKAKVIDPSRLTGDKYKVTFTRDTAALRWNLINVTKGDTVLKNQTSVLSLTDLTDDEANIIKKIDRGNVIIDGFLIGVADPGTSVSRIREVSMVKDAGNDVAGSGIITTFVPRKGVNVFGVGTTTTSRGWWVTATNYTTTPAGTSLEWLNWGGVIGENDCEVRFTTDSSEFYIPSFPGVMTHIYKNNPKSPKSKIPLQFWDIGPINDPAQHLRLYVKVFETKEVGIKDSLWNATVVNKGPVRRDSIMFEELYFMRPPPDSVYQTPIPATSGTSNNARYPVGKFTLMTRDLTELPKPGTVIRIITWKPVKDGEAFEFVAAKPKVNDVEIAKKNLENINVFPNPYFGAHELERDKYQRFVRFTNLPAQVSIRIFSLAGVFITRVDKNDATTFADWDLRNIDGLPVASGVYIAHLEMPGIGAKVLKIAVIMETQYIDRL